MHILIAPNAFKNSISAAGAAEAIFAGLKKSGLDFNADLFPVADGGDGTAELLQQRLEAESIPVKVTNPLGKLIDTHFGWLEKRNVAIIELANASGLRLLDPSTYDPIRANTRGTGQIILRALELGAGEIVLAIGGSATVDGGTGILTELGIRFLDSGRQQISDLPGGLSRLADIDDSGLDPRVSRTRFTVLCDVSNPLLGEYGAAKIFGPQKGASPGDVMLLEAGLAQFCDCSLRISGKDMNALEFGGAAGGVAAGLAIWLKADLVNGIKYFLQITSFSQVIQNMDLVITGEGRLDHQTIQGKAPFGVAQAAIEKNIPVVAMAGQVADEDRNLLGEFFNEIIGIYAQATDIEQAIKDTAKNLEEVARLLGNRLKSR